jgi:hypothetical protein
VITTLNFIVLLPRAKLPLFWWISWCNQLYGCLTNQWEAEKLPYPLLYYRSPLHSTSNRWSPELSLCSFPLFRVVFVSAV